MLVILWLGVDRCHLHARHEEAFRGWQASLALDVVRMNPDGYTSPEKAAEMMLARRTAKRLKAHHSRYGLCSTCIHREQTFGMHHCRNKPDRQAGTCQHDDRLPKYTFDAETLKGVGNGD